MDKYEILRDSENTCGRLHRIRALIDFDDVSAGDIGGWVESEENLSQDGNCWIYRSATVRENANVADNAKIYDQADICDNARVYGNAKVYEKARICGNATIYGNATISGETIVCDNATVYGCAILLDFATVCNKGTVCDNANITDKAMICEDAIICGTAKIYGSAKVAGTSKISGRAELNNNTTVDKILNESKELQEFKRKLAEKLSKKGKVSYYDCMYQYTYNHYDQLSNECPTDEIVDISVELLGGPASTWKKFRKMLKENDFNGGYDDNYGSILFSIAGEAYEANATDKDYRDVIEYGDEKYDKIADMFEKLLGPVELWRIVEEHSITGMEGAELFTNFLKYANL